MLLSIVIVNYNVKYFIEQCLHSVKKAIEGIETEVFVVDNNSVDGSCNHIRERFPWVKLIDNQENVGFSKANNQAIRLSKGKYVLLLNPDTVVEEDTFSKCIQFMDKHPDAGSLGVKMIDGRGHYLPESKRALPTPRVAFYKIFGLSSLFPKSRIFGKYHLGYLDKDQVHEVDILAGAFMFLRMETLEKVGLLDEDYFMYGEDIDLSYRITKGGYKNYYYPETTIIHYKGESTKKGSLNYVVVFYNAMIIFATKHFASKRARAYSMIIHMAIYLRAALSLIRRFTKRIYRQLIDALIIFAGFFIGLPLWGNFKFGNSDYYPPEMLYYVVPSYILLWLLSSYYVGGYEKPLKLWHYIRGIAIGTFIILVIYALLPENWRFSRAIILLGTAWTLLSTTLFRWLMHLSGNKDFELDLNKKKRMVVVGNPEEAGRVSNLLGKTQIKPEIVGYVSQNSSSDPSYIGSLEQIEDIVRIHKLDEIVFCALDISSRRIISVMTKLTGVPVNYKIAPPESLSIIGSNSINTAGELYTINFNSIGKASNLRTKRLFDLFTSLILIPLFPLWALFVPSCFKALGRMFHILVGSRTLVGYYVYAGFDRSSLPAIKRGILTPGGGLYTKDIEQEEADRINVMYAKDYKLSNDIIIFWKGFRRLGE
jgi:O-antigen biosynthesis protein